MNTSLREGIIKEYLSTVNFNENNWSYHTIESDLQKLIGERPSLRINRERDVMLTENMDESKEIEVIKSVDVIYTDDNDKIKKYTILL